MRHPRSSLAALAGSCAVLLSSCAPPQPDRMEILVATTPPGASCLLSRLGQPIATAGPTPAIALVDPSEAEITIQCRRQGFADASVTLAPRPATPAFGVLFAPAPAENQQRVDITLAPR